MQRDVHRQNRNNHKHREGVAMPDVQTWAKRWKGQLTHVLQLQHVQKYLRELFGGVLTQKALEEIAHDAATETASCMKLYAGAWKRASEEHRLHGTYASAIDQWNLPRDALIVDLGCGSGGLLEELVVRGYRRLIGVDVNPFLLQVCAERLEQHCVVQMMGETTYSFSGEQGFVLRGSPVMPEPRGVESPILIADDLANPHNLIRLLGVNGLTADHVVYMLAGGNSTTTRGQFVRAIQQSGREWMCDSHVRIDVLAKNLLSVIAEGGRLHLALRAAALTPEDLEGPAYNKAVICAIEQSYGLDNVAGFHQESVETAMLAAAELQHIELTSVVDDLIDTSTIEKVLYMTVFVRNSKEEERK